MKSSTSNIKVFYEVIEQPERPTGVQTVYSYQTANCQLLGIAYSFDEMVYSVRQEEVFSHSALELIQVLSLVPVSNKQPDYQSVQDNDNTMTNKQWAYPIFKASDLEWLFSDHKIHDIPLNLTVGLACKLLNINIRRLLEETGYSKNYFSNTLNGAHAPADDFRKIIIEKLGIDPWLYSPLALPVIVRREIIPANVH